MGNRPGRELGLRPSPALMLRSPACYPVSSSFLLKVGTACKPHNFAVKMERGNETSAKSAACTERAKGRSRVLGAACRVGPRCRWLPYPEDAGRARSVPALSPATLRGEPMQRRCRTCAEMADRAGAREAWVGPVTVRLLPDQDLTALTLRNKQSPQTAGRLRV